jgi:hypothetical protein
VTSPRRPTYQRWLTLALSLSACNAGSGGPVDARPDLARADAIRERALARDAASDEGRPAPVDLARGDRGGPDGKPDATTTPIKAPITAAFVHFGYSAADDALPTAALAGFLDDLAGLGVDTLIVAQTRSKQASAGCGGSAASFEWVAGFPAKLEAVLDEAKLRGMKVYVGTTLSMSACTSFASGANPPLVQADVASSMAALHASYGAHAAFAGWYIPDEPGHAGAAVHAYFAGVAAVLKKIASTPIAVAPFLAGTPPPPATIAANALAFKSANGIDLQIWQDSVGASAAKLAPWSRAGSTAEA